jgi:hypothetical protein
MRQHNKRYIAVAKGLAVDSALLDLFSNLLSLESFLFGLNTKLRPSNHHLELHLYAKLPPDDGLVRLNRAETWLIQACAAAIARK